MAAPRRSVEPVPAFAREFAAAQDRLPGAGSAGVLDLRKRSFEHFAAAGIPTTRAEAWRYTNVAKLANIAMGLAPKAPLALNTVAEWFAGGVKARRIIFVNGHLVPEFCHVESLPEGVEVMSLGRALDQQPERVRAAMAEAQDDRSFTALNAAFAGAGVWIELKDGVRLEEPLQLLFFTQGQPAAVMTHPRNVVSLGKGARLRLIESHIALSEGHCLTNLVNQISLGEDALLEHDRLQLLRDGSSLIGKSFIHLKDRAILRATTATLGGTLVRNEHEALLAGENVDCVLSGTYLPKGVEHVDTLIRIQHQKPNSRSDQFYKGVVTDAAHAVFAGKIIVDRAAQKTNAYQKNDNLLLSDEAEIDTKPELEIYADDVKCSHGATIGELDPAALFYMRSRGLDAGTARSLLTFAFAAEALERFSDDTLRRQARVAIARRLPGAEVLSEFA